MPDNQSESAAEKARRIAREKLERARKALAAAMAPVGGPDRGGVQSANRNAKRQLKILKEQGDL